MLLVWEAVKSQGRATPEEIFKSVARQMDIPFDDKNFRRNIYRDLRTFSDSGRLGVEYFTPDGAPIPPDEESSYANVRVEYFIQEAQESVPGHGILEERGGCFVPSGQRKIKWKIQLFDQAELEGQVNFVFEARDHLFLTLQVPVDELPVKILVARDPGSENKRPPQEVLNETLGLRYGVLYLNHRTLSRPEGTAKVGHALIEITKTGNSARITDLGSKSGTYWAPSTAEFLHELKGHGAQDATLNPNSSLMGQNIAWIKLKAGETQSLPVFILMGGFPMLVG
ncbi:MAG: hypothetical protein H6624_01495 [Bdellovibrionaceae bacterium]|nr:hypothetical protein [Bdellovibrionales bacterium]MCB9082982.1 hypothetical protein [Pseudobdellovibrionaceae bacterium]